MRVTSGMLAGWVLLNAVGCATIFNADPQTIAAKASNEKEVAVEITTPTRIYHAKLPATISAESGPNGVRIKITDACYDPATSEVPKAITTSFWVNILNGYGFIVDAITAKMWKYEGNFSMPVQEKKDCPQAEGKEAPKAATKPATQS